MSKRRAKTDESIKFIEKKENIRLTDFQKLYVEYIMNTNDTFYITRSRGYGKRHMQNVIRDLKEKLGDVDCYEYKS